MKKIIFCSLFLFNFLCISYNSSAKNYGSDQNVTNDRKKYYNKKQKKPINITNSSKSYNDINISTDSVKARRSYSYVRSVLPPRWKRNIELRGPYTKDIKTFPLSYGDGSGTVRKWIIKNIVNDYRSVEKNIYFEVNESEIANTLNYPRHWGDSPKIDPKNSRKVRLPLDYGYGDEALAQWIVKNIKNDYMAVRHLDN